MKSGVNLCFKTRRRTDIEEELTPGRLGSAAARQPVWRLAVMRGSSLLEHLSRPDHATLRLFASIRIRQLCQ